MKRHVRTTGAREGAVELQGEEGVTGAIWTRGEAPLLIAEKRASTVKIGLNGFRDIWFWDTLVNVYGQMIKMKYIGE